MKIRKNAALNMARQACAIVFPFLMFSYSSHVLGAGQMGAYTFAQSVVSYFAYIAMLGVSDYAVREAAIVREDKEKLGKFANEVFSIHLLSTLAAYILLFWLLHVWGRLHPYRSIIFIQSMQFALAAFGADWVNTAFEDFLYLTVRYIAVELACTASMLLLVKSPDDLCQYTFLSMLAAAGGNILNVFYIRKYVRLRPTVHLNLRRHLPPILTLFGNSVALAIYLNSDITILGLLAGDAAVGVYAAPTKIYMMVKALINAAIMAAVPGLSNMLASQKLDEYKQTLANIANVLCLLTIPAAVGLFFEAEDIVVIVAGSGYLGGAAILRIYSFTIPFAVCACFLSYGVLMPSHREKYFLLATALAAGLNIGLNFWLIPRLGSHGAALTTLLAEMTVVAIAAYFVQKKSIAKGAAKDMAENTARDKAKDTVKDVEKDAAKDMAKDTARDKAKDVAKDMEKDAARDKAKDAAIARDMPKDTATDKPKNAARDAIRDIGIEIIGGAVIGCICLAVRQIGLPRILNLGLSMILAGAGYCIVLLAMKNQTFLSLCGSFSRRH